MTEEQESARAAIVARIDAVVADMAGHKSHTEEQKRTLAKDLAAFRATYGTYGRGWAKFVKERWHISGRMASRYMAVGKKLAEPGAERFEGKSLAYIERGGPPKPRPRGHSSKVSPQHFADLCDRCRALIQETSFDREAA